MEMTYNHVVKQTTKQVASDHYCMYRVVNTMLLNNDTVVWPVSSEFQHHTIQSTWFSCFRHLLFSFTRKRQS